MRGVSLVAGVIFLALTITAAMIIYQAGVPLVQDLQATAAVDKMKVTLADLDEAIRTVAAGGQGTKRTVFLSPDPGELTINATTDTVLWELQTTAPVITPRTAQQFGNLLVGSHLETSVTEGNYTRVTPEVPAFIMENDRLVVYVNRTGSPTGFAPIETDQLVLALYNKDRDAWLENPGFLEVSIDHNPNSKFGDGYTQATLGDHLPFGKVEAYFDTAYIDYRLFIILESGADFITIEAEEA